MYRFFRKNNKKLLAVFAAFLMIVFVLPTTNLGSPPDPVVAEIGGEEIRHTELEQATVEWNVLGQTRTLVPDPSTNQLSPIPMTLLTGWLASFEINDHPELFLVLWKEAEQMGVTVDPDRVESIMTNRMDQSQNDPAYLDTLRSAVTHALMIEGAFERVANVVKVSEPMLRRGLAHEGQEIKVNLVEFPAGVHADETLAPTEEQLKAHFEKYADVDPNQLPADHSGFAFGYQQPARVKLQYVAVPREELRTLVENAKTEYEWEVASYKHYTRNPQNYPSTQPASTQPTTQEAAAPTTRPFEEVKPDVRQALIAEETEKLAKEIESRIQSILAADWLAYRNATAGKDAQSAEAPASSMGVPYTSHEYLERLAQQIQKQYKFLPTVVSIAEPKWSKELSALQGIGLAYADGLDFASYATQRAEPLLTEEEQKQAGDVLSLYEPSQPLRDFATNSFYFFRLTDAQKAQRPASLDEVRAKVTEDYRIARGYETALAKAKELAKAADPARLSSAAEGKTVLTTGYFSNAPWATIENFALSGSAQQTFMRETFALLNSVTDADKHPARVVELPQTGKVLVIELEDVRQRADGTMTAMNQNAIQARLMSEYFADMQRKWFSYEEAQKRTGFQYINEQG